MYLKVQQKRLVETPTETNLGNTHSSKYAKTAMKQQTNNEYDFLRFHCVCHKICTIEGKSTNLLFVNELGSYCKYVCNRQT